jgi:hypothetical protein
LELAGSVSALTDSTNNIQRADITSAGNLQIDSGSIQQVGGIDGTGTTTVSAGASLTANYIVQSALVIGGTAGSAALVTIDASDPNGNPTAASGGLVLAGSLAPSGPFAEGVINSESMSTATTDSTDLAILAMGKPVGSDNPAPVPEPSTLLLALLATLGVAGAQHARKRSWATRI